jgi:gamma-glutamylcyclotransferase (GGCT)/AIG2-like uncharacterized protein YtfP
VSAYLFAYGTLQAGLAPAEIARVVARFTSLGEGFLIGTLFDFGRFPGLVLDEAGAGRVYGTIYVLPSDPAVLDALDDYEGFDPARPGQSQFVRVLCPVMRVEGGPLPCWVYTFEGPTGSAPVIAGGRYRRSETPEEPSGATS